MTIPTMADKKFKIQRRGLMLALSAPSGGGKTTISRRLIEQDPLLSVSISATTRAKRAGEEEGKHYTFVTHDDFKKMIDQGDLLEHAEIYGEMYGTPARPVQQALSAGRDVIFDIDWQGTHQLSAVAKEDLVSIYILPPSREELERRLRGRGQDSEQEITKRLEKAAEELSHYVDYQYVVINNDLDESVSQVRAILEAERIRRSRQVGLDVFVDQLRSDL